MLIKPISQEDKGWVTQVLTNLWGSTRMVTRGRLMDLASLEGFIAEEEGRKVGLITYVIASKAKQSQPFVVIPSESEGSNSPVIPDSDPGSSELECEITSLNALTPGKGIGSMLIQKVEEVAKKNGCKRLVVITTNDNPKAVEFYEKKGFSIFTVRKNIMDEYRKLKPEIPLTGNDGLPLTDEIELHKAI